MDIRILSKKHDMDGHVLRVKVAVPEETRAALVDEALAALASDAQIACCKDEARAKLTERFGAQRLATDVTSHISTAATAEVARELGLKVMFAAEPKRQVIETVFDAGEVEQELEFVLQPSIGLSSYGPVYVRSAARQVDERQVEAYLEGLRAEKASFEEAAGPVAEGDFLLVDMQTEVDGALQESLSGQRMTIELARGKMPAPFVDAVVGMSVGSTKLFGFSLPGQNGAPEEFSVDLTVRDRRRKITPVLDDAFVAEHFGEVGSTVAELRVHARELLEAHAAYEDAQQREIAADAELATRLDSAIPDLYIERMSKDVYRRLQEQLAEQGLTVQAYLEREGLSERQFQMQVMSQARDALRQGFALDALCAHLGGELSDDDIERALAELAPGRQAEAREFFEKNGTWSLVTQMAGRLKAHDWLMETAVFAR